MVVQIDLVTVSINHVATNLILTAHFWSVFFLITVHFAGWLTCFPVRVQSILPLRNFSDLLITIFVLLVTIWSSWIIDIIPILRNYIFFFVLLSPFSPSPLSFLASSSTIKTVHIIICCPIRQCTFDGWSHWVYRWYW